MSSAWLIHLLGISGVLVVCGVLFFLFLRLLHELLFENHTGVRNALQWNPTAGPMLTWFIDRLQHQIDLREGVGEYSLGIVDLSKFPELINPPAE